MNLSQVFDILMEEELDQVPEWKEADNGGANTIHRAIGNDFMEARRPGSGGNVDYTIKDVRRIVAYLRLTAVTGTAKSTASARMYDAMKNVAMNHDDGVSYFDGERANWAASLEDQDLIDVLQSGQGVIIIPCFLKSELKNNGTVALETEQI